HGIVTAVIDYRLLPKVPWKDQIQDVAGAVSWVYRHAAEFGGNPKAFYLSGHSAGAQLAARVALDPEPLQKEGLSKKIVSGVVAVSGAGYQIVLEKDKAPLRSSAPVDAALWTSNYMERRFAEGDATGAWASEVSMLRFLDASAPPFLVLCATAEPAS